MGIIKVDLDAAKIVDDRPVGAARNVGDIAYDTGCCIMRIWEEGWLLATGKGHVMMMVVGWLALE